jgi:hypothetical protein
MCFDGGWQKLTEHGRQGMRPLAACNGVTEIGDCGYDRVARLTSPFFHACLAYISLLLSAAAVQFKLIKQLSLSESGPLTSLRLKVNHDHTWGVYPYI